MKPHRFFTAEQTHHGWALFFQARPIQTEHEGVAVQLRVPVLRASEHLADPHLTLPRIAALLEDHWNHGDREGTPRQ